MKFRSLFLAVAAVGALCASASMALAQTAVLDQTPVPTTSTSKSENVLQSYAVPGGTIYQGFFRSPGAVPTWSSGLAFAPTLSGPQQVYNAVTTAMTSNNANLAAASLTGGSLLVAVDYTGTSSGGGANTLTLPSVAATVTAMKAAGLNPAAGQTWELDLFNDEGTGTGTLALLVDTGATWTLVPSSASTIAKTVAMQRLIITLTTLTAGTIQSLGTYTTVAAP